MGATLRKIGPIFINLKSKMLVFLVTLIRPSLFLPSSLLPSVLSYLPLFSSDKHFLSSCYFPGTKFVAGYIGFQLLL